MKTTMKAVQVLAKGEPMRLVEVPIPQPEEGQVLIRVEACGICHGDSKVIEGWASEYPRIPGHEVVGTIEKLGKNISKWEVGQRVGIGWHGGHGHTTALSIDGGYAEYMVAYEDGLILIPEGITSEEAAPLLCAGETVFSALHNSRARMGDLIAVSGVGGLGHLAVQYARKAGFRVAAISRGEEKKELVMRLGAHLYINSDNEDIVQALQAQGGAKVILATAPSAKAISPLIGGLDRDGELIVAAVSDEPLGWSAMDFLKGTNAVKGTFTDINEMEAAVRFSMLTDVRPIIEIFPLERAKEAYEKMMAAKTHFRAVLKINA
ncbi:alcohol dehydrogenase catalytic domain-containing protein [Phocaeicola dorei]|uniref:alcohol dehydrogenase catalytic domain-containing protein n=1 Tax=Phocaeicola dorei TaxID=357276 RepID=UPI001C383AA1|nr:alcohol dehydrogenase catalytic domain-containing protein [Phocaeicola dorei]MBV4238718.1 alcohol dehydrogenase catalytic domain-containing protein [Phocaeicola dorei]MCB6461295.1 alcohol dehydrogenase catalytic domain-containing protein [Phocaeicola dorei]MCB6746512.1 alcohol dehydrogenase catalytic domain-containing protein [Phocaeicola dorei]MCB6772078.1 alcohol dehydrogenase catalytic domain-containing protein [Phocaeicola dorei]MCB6790713.1 alcohol dehydrogenase catalytic domain-contai